MSVTKVINVEVQSGDLNQLNSDLQKVEKSFKKVEKEADKTTQELKEIGDNGGAIAILDELTGGLATKLRDAGEASKLFNFSLKGTRKALIATGIGAFVVALGTVVAYWDEIIDFIKGANTELEKQKRIIEQIGNELDRQKFNNELNLELIALQTEQDVKRAKLAGKTEKEITEIRKQGIKNRIAELENAAAIALKLERDAAIVGGEEFEKAQKKRIELEKAASNERIALVNFELDQEIKAREKSRSGQGVETDQVSAVNSTENAELTQFANIEGIKTEIVLDEISKREKGRQSSAQTEIMLEKSVAQAKVDIAQNTLALLGSVVEEGSVVGKGIAVAQATISGIEGVQNAFTTAAKSPITTVFPAYPTIQAGLAAAFSAIQIKKILSTDPTGRTAPNLGGAGGAGLGGASAPSFNVVGT